MSTNTVLIIEDERAIAQIIDFNLRQNGFEVKTAYDGLSGLEMALSEDVGLVLLDVMLPGLDGFEVLRRLRMKSSVPVIMVTAREEEQDKILGLETGADDYITKPFSMRELVARVRANMRRAPGQNDPGDRNKKSFGPFKVDLSMQQVTKNDRPVELTQREYELVLYFIASPMRVISREELIENVWRYEYYGDLRTVDVAMRRLREKLEDDPADPRYIITKRGAGYFIQEGQ